MSTQSKQKTQKELKSLETALERQEIKRKEFEKLEKTELHKLEEKIVEINNKAKTEIQKKYENEQKD